MDKIKLKSVDHTPPVGWKKTWYGYFQMEKVISEVKKQRDKVSHKASDRSKLKNAGEPLIGEGYLEQQFFLNIIQSLEGRVDMMELGAGRGDWCLATAGVIDFKLVDTQATSYRCLAVEAEPIHYEWTKIHFEEQGLNATAVHGAVWSENGECSFYAKEDPASHYGQSIRPDGNLTVPCYTVDTLMEKHGFDKVDFMHVDIQGAEYEMLKGMKKALENGSIKYMMIGTHRPEMNDRLMGALELYGYEIIFSARCHSNEPVDTPFGKATLPVDGILLVKHANS